MGVSANSLEVDFTIPADKVAAALAVVNATFVGAHLAEGGNGIGAAFDSLTEAVEENTSFMDNEETKEDGFRLGYHVDRYCSYTEQLLELLAPYATEGSYVRFIGEEDCLFGFRVVAGKLVEEYGDITWKISGE